jgi:hypothetical protein
MNKVKNALILLVGWSFVFLGFGPFSACSAGDPLHHDQPGHLTSRSELVKQFLSYLEHRFTLPRKGRILEKKVRTGRKGLTHSTAANSAQSALSEIGQPSARLRHDPVECREVEVDKE